MQIVQYTTHGRSSFIAMFDDEERICEMPSRWLQSQLTGPNSKADLTVDLYARNLRYFLEAVTKSELYRNLTIDDIIQTISSGTIDSYLTELSHAGLSRATIHNRDVTLKAFFDWLTTDEASRFRLKSPYAGKLKTPSPYDNHVRYVLADDVIHLLKHVHSECWRCVIHFVYESGARSSEIRRVTKKDFLRLEGWPEHMNYAPIELQGSKGRGRQLKPRSSLISKPVISRVRRMHSSMEYRKASQKYRSAGETPAFFNINGEPVTERSLSAQLRAAAVRAGLNPREFSPHNLRHGAALSILKGEMGVDYLDKLVLIQKQFGHSNIKSTEAYTKIPPQLYAQIGEGPEIKTRFEEAQRIFDSTFLSRARHSEKRGRKL